MPRSMNDELTAWLRLTLAPGIGGQTQRRLLAAFGPAPAVFSAGRSAIVGVIGSAAAARLLDSDNAAAVAAAHAWRARGDDRHIVVLGDADYPQALLEIDDPPTLLYVRGRRELLNRPALAIVGSRNATPAGVRNAEQFAAALSGSGLVIVSGLALGIDGAAHRGALAAGGDTLAFIGTGIDRVYPSRHQELAREIATHGAIVSEFALGTPPLPPNFPRRNRLIAGIARGVLVVEAATGSGSLITARLAAEQGREVFAIPGSIHSPLARGCHQLLRLGAKLAESAQDVLEELAWASPPPVPGKAAAGAAGAAAAGPDDAEAARLLDALGHEARTLDQLVQGSGLTADRLSVILLELELAGRVASLPGDCYQRLPES